MTAKFELSSLTIRKVFLSSSGGGHTVVSHSSVYLRNAVEHMVVADSMHRLCYDATIIIYFKSTLASDF